MTWAKSLFWYILEQSTKSLWSTLIKNKKPLMLWKQKTSLSLVTLSLNLSLSLSPFQKHVHLYPSIQISSSIYSSTHLQYSSMLISFFIYASVFPSISTSLYPSICLCLSLLIALCIIISLCPSITSFSSHLCIPIQSAIDLSIYTSLYPSRYFYLPPIYWSTSFSQPFWWRIILKHEHKGSKWTYPPPPPPYLPLCEIIHSLNGWRRPL